MFKGSWSRNWFPNVGVRFGFPRKLRRSFIPWRYVVKAKDSIEVLLKVRKDVEQSPVKTFSRRRKKVSRFCEVMLSDLKHELAF